MVKAAAVLLLLAASVSAADVVSKAPDAVSATLYQSYRGMPDVALIVETRTVELPAGDSVLRFDGVASSLIPATAQILGLAEPARESDFDFDLFDAATVLRKSVGQSADLVETPVKAPEIHHRGTLVSNQGVLALKGEEGVESFGCGGPSARLDVPIPVGLRAVPSLSVHLHSDHSEKRVVHLSYLAGNLRWHAAYVAKIAENGRRLALMGRIVLDNDTTTSFTNVPTRFVAGELNRTRATTPPAIAAQAVQRDCWSLAKSTDPVGWDPGADYLRRMVALMEQQAPVGVTANKMMMTANAVAPVSAPAIVPGAQQNFVTQESLGDLKLYRLSEPVRIAARQQKFFEFLSLPSVEAERIYLVTFPNATTVEGASAQAVWHVENLAAKGLGKPLPKGAVTLYAGGVYWGDDVVQSDVADGGKFDLHGPRLGEVVFDHWVTSESRSQGMIERTHILILRNMLGVEAVVDVPKAAGDRVRLDPHETRRLTYDT